VVEDGGAGDFESGPRRDPSQGKPIGHWIATFRGKDENASRDAGSILAQIGEPAIPELIPVLNDPNDELRARTRITLGRVRGGWQCVRRGAGP
jgi:hypothetical protein